MSVTNNVAVLHFEAKVVCHVRTGSELNRWRNSVAVFRLLCAGVFLLGRWTRTPRAARLVPEQLDSRRSSLSLSRARATKAIRVSLRPSARVRLRADARFFKVPVAYGGFRCLLCDPILIAEIEFMYIFIFF